MYLHNTSEAHILYYVWLKPIGGLHAFEITFFYRIPLLYIKIVSL